MENESFYHDFFEIKTKRGVKGYYEAVKFNHTTSAILKDQTKPNFSKIFVSEITGFDEKKHSAFCSALAVFEVFENLDCFLTIQIKDSKDATMRAEVNCIEIAKDYAIKKFNQPLRLMKLEKTFI